MSTQDLNSLNADINVSDPSEYVDNAGPGLLPEDWYTLNLRKYDVVTDPDTGAFKNAFNMAELVVADGPMAGRVVRNIRIFATTFKRKTSSGAEATVSMLGDFLRGIDDQAEWSGVAGACAILDKAIDQNTPIRIKLNWEAFDWEGYRDEGGQKLTKKSPEEKELRKKATIKKMANFPVNAAGVHQSKVVGPLSGEPIEARLVVDRVIVSSQR
jgi:hypothetical protein